MDICKRCGINVSVACLGIYKDLCTMCRCGYCGEHSVDKYCPRSDPEFEKQEFQNEKRNAKNRRSRERRKLRNSFKTLKSIGNIEP